MSISILYKWLSILVPWAIWLPPLIIRVICPSTPIYFPLVSSHYPNKIKLFHRSGHM
ncbi:hypothetical protein L208DRAFT_1465943 [Tricholoma matsutake]|nr:hypothetical protein L208DRAFT_1465943 [Tricholoma matsutake 945]